MGRIGVTLGVRIPAAGREFSKAIMTSQAWEPHGLHVVSRSHAVAWSMGVAIFDVDHSTMAWLGRGYGCWAEGWPD